MCRRFDPCLGRSVDHWYNGTKATCARECVVRLVLFRSLILSAWRLATRGNVATRRTAGKDRHNLHAGETAVSPDTEKDTRAADGRGPKI